MKILLIGPPASGKGTIGKLLSKHYNIPVVTPGKILREIPIESELYQPVNDVMSKGGLVDNKIVAQLLKDTLKDSRYENGYILDGWLRQLPDLDEFDPKPDVVLNLIISREESEKRTLNRRYCELNKHDYNLVSNPPKEDGVCDIDGSKLLIREDDKLDVLNNRWDVYNYLTSQSIDFFKKQGILVEVLGEGKVEEILNHSIEKINNKVNITNVL